MGDVDSAGSAEPGVEMGGDFDASVGAALAPAPRRYRRTVLRSKPSWRAMRRIGHPAAAN
jgi:hypothetical protein